MYIKQKKYVFNALHNFCQLTKFR